MSRFATSFGFLFFVVAIVLLLGLIQIFLLWAFNREWWRRRTLRRLSLLVPVVAMLAMAMWGAGEYRQIEWLSKPGMILTALMLVLELALFLSLPISGIFHLINRALDYLVRHRKTDTAVDSNRRMVLKGLAASVPIIAIGSGGTGFVRSFGPVNVYLKPLELDSLPSDLHGFRILHLSDMHLREYTTLDTLETVMADAREYKPDLILVTGDVADDLRQLPGALSMVEQFGAPRGYFASLGNHEYFRGVARVKAIFDQSGVPLFVNQGQRLTIGTTPVYICGIDDPRRLGAKETTFYHETIDKTMVDRRADDFVILMSHRPDAFDYASEQRINLILSGHTHGGQIGIGGRSLFETVWHDRYLWGAYRKAGSVLYTSSGVGHWFPFRLGCPAEAPIIELRQRMAG